MCLYNGGGVSRLRCCRNATEPSFPRKWESRISGFQSFPIDSRRVVGLDSRLCGNDGFRDCGANRQKPPCARPKCNIKT
ncbi:hypothetical protein EUA25_03665 [Neisseria meningitidis]|nr:hypothetical protein EUA25_03665 [Neisseria meningitidis]